MTVFEPMKPLEVSLNLTTGETRQLTDIEAGQYERPLFISTIFICYEVVVWSNTWQMWLVIVDTRTQRDFPPSARTREISIADWPWYEAEAKRLGLRA